MKVLLHCDEYYPTSQACALRMQVFSDTFIALGDEVTVVTSSANKANGTIIKDKNKEKIIYSPTIRINKKKSTVMRTLNNLTFGITSIFAALGAGKADIVITTSPPALISISGWIISKCKGAKLVYDVRDIWPDVALEMKSFTEDSFFCKVFKIITEFMYKHSDIVTTVSLGKVEKLKEKVRSLSIEKSRYCDTDKVWFVGNGFDENIVKSVFDQTIIDKYEIDSKFTCVYIGNIGLAQELGILLDIATKTRHKDIQFLCFGMGAEKEKLEKRVEEERITNVKFCGVIDHCKVYSVLSHAKLSFIPLKNSNMRDSIPSKVYEALGIGCPVLLVAEGDSANVVADSGLGKSISPDEPIEKVIDLFDYMIDHYNDFNGHRDEAIKLMHNKYSRQKIAKEFAEKLHQLCGNQKH